MSLDNPYAPDATVTDPVSHLRLADVGKRFVGFLVDGIVGFVAMVPGYALTILSGAADGNGIGAALGFLGIVLTAVASLGVLIAQIYLLATRAQTIGKLIMKTQIIDIRTGQKADLVHSFLLRMLVNGLICGIPCLGLIYFIVDSCYVFRPDRRCVHDHLASTCVVDIS